VTASTRVSDALEIAKTRLTEFDSKNQLSSSAADYMAPHIARAQEAALRIAEVAKTLRTSAEVPVAGMTAALGHGAAAVNQLRVKAAEYDQVRALLQLLVPNPPLFALSLASRPPLLAPPLAHSISCAFYNGVHLIPIHPLVHSKPKPPLANGVHLIPIHPLVHSKPKTPAGKRRPFANHLSISLLSPAHTASHRFTPLLSSRTASQLFKVSASVVSVTAIIKEQETKVTALFSTAAESFQQVSEVAHARLQGVSDGLRTQVRSRVDSLNVTINEFAGNQVQKVKDAAIDMDSKYAIRENAAALAGAAGEKAKAYNEAYGVTDKVKGYVGKAQELDAQYKVSENVLAVAGAAAEKGKALDERFTRGKVYEAYQYGVGLAATGLESVKGYAGLAGEEVKEGDAAPVDAMVEGAAGAAVPAAAAAGAE
jgi:hypothetical protein